MPEKDTVFSSKVKYGGIVSFKDLYKFCYDWVNEEIEIKIEEKKYAEKLSGNLKDIDIVWEGGRKLTDYFKFHIKVVFKVIGLEEVEINQGGTKVKTNKAVSIEISVKGTLIRDYEGKFEESGTKKFFRSVYEKWIIPSRVEQFEDKVIGDCDEFLSQAKAYMDLEGKR